jgi:effector-binding domain-containing protein
MRQTQRRRRLRHRAIHHGVSEVTDSFVNARPIAAIAAETSWPAYPSLWPKLLDEVWTALRSDKSVSPGRNVMLYLDDVPHVEVGAEIDGPFEPFGRVVPSALPAGRVATTVHRGAYERIGDAHAAVIAWCEERGLERAGARWEIYGHQVPNVADQEVEIYWLLEGGGS